MFRASLTEHEIDSQKKGREILPNENLSESCKKYLIRMRTSQDYELILQTKMSLL
jgi:hypothetical protein